MLEDQLYIDMGNVNHVQKLGMLKVVYLLDTGMVFGLVQVVKMADLDNMIEVAVGLMVQKVVHMIGNGKANQDIENVVVCVFEVGMVGQKVGNMVDVGKVSCKVHRVVDIGLGKVIVIHIHSKHFHANLAYMSQNMALVHGKNVGHNRMSNVAQMSKVPPFDNPSLHSLGRDLP
ncbi:hypothetical protein PIB30_088242 [Stylosanthes scabra]|uniref:Uncharacterized protein n=1 Tax=Stylosanthes scabra TaxID=79078 RepID=A0ABU6WS10_9FABA|nr:hypothetical protein [Stylosanthes scabra]